LIQKAMAETGQGDLELFMNVLGTPE
jgi:hypothetical protein